MPLLNAKLTDEFAGKALSEEKLTGSGWSNQSGANFHYGFPKKRGLWLKRIPSTQQCGHHTIWLFVLLILGKGKVVKEVHEAVHMVHNDGGYDDMGVPFFAADVDTARQEITAVLAGE